MAAIIKRLKTRDQRLKASAASRFVTLADEMEMLAQELGRESPEDVRRVRSELEREALAEAGWTFVMINPTQFAAVASWLADHAHSRVVALRLWTTIFAHLDPKTGEVLASRAELAELAKTTPDQVTRAMGELTDIGAITRHRQPANGPVRYFINPRVGTCLRSPARELAQRDAPKLRLVPIG